MVKAVVQNPAYKGFVRYNGKLYAAKHEPIVDAETWEQANRAIGNRREDDNGLRYKDDHVHLLKGVVKCGVCGLAVTPYPSGRKTQDGTPYLYYTCVNFTKDRTHTTCPIRMLPARDFEALVKGVLADLGTNPTILQSCIDAANREAIQSVTDLEQRLLQGRDEIGLLTAAIRRIIEVMKQEDFLAEDIKEEYKWLIREKQRLQALCEKLEFDIERRKKGVLDVELIRRSLQDFARLVGLLPLEDQKELCQLLLREVEVSPFDPGTEEVSSEERAFTNKIRTRWYRVRIALYQLPDVALVHRASESSDNGPTGSPMKGKIRTSLNVTILAGKPAATQRCSPLTYALESAPLPRSASTPAPPEQRSNRYRNPIILAQDWQQWLDDGAGRSRADLARQLGVSPLAMTARNGVRVSTKDAYLEPARERPNLTTVGDTHVDRVLFEGRCATGVRARTAEGRTEFSVRTIILSAGATHSPAILLRSGIGSADQLTSLGIELVADLPVGKNLIEHPSVAFQLDLRPEAQIVGQQTRHISCYVRYASGLPGTGMNDMLLRGSNLAGHRADGQLQGTLMVGAHQVFSRGQLRITAPDPDGQPEITFRMLSDERPRPRPCGRPRAPGLRYGSDSWESSL